MNFTKDNKKYQVLKDGKNTEKWRDKRLQSERIAVLYSMFDNKKYFRVKNCGTFLGWKEYDDKEKKLYQANFCKVRLCPMCSWRRSLKVFGQVSQIMDYLEANFNYRYIFITLTIKNCSGGDLGATVDKLLYAYNKFTKQKEIKKIVKGSFRALEFTYNAETNTYHPHIHLVVAVPSYYFNVKGYYITHQRYREIWQQCLCVDYLPQVNVKVFRSKQKKSVAEVASYSVKDFDFSNLSDERASGVLEIFDRCLYKRRLISFSKCFREAHQKLKLSKNIDDDLVNTDNDTVELREDLNYTIVYYKWHIGLANYIRVE